MKGQDRIMMVMSALKEREQGIVIDEPTLRCHHNPLVGTLGHVFIGYVRPRVNKDIEKRIEKVAPQIRN